jgi:hypothetical protein
MNRIKKSVKHNGRNMEQKGKRKEKKTKQKR